MRYRNYAIVLACASLLVSCTQRGPSQPPASETRAGALEAERLTPQQVSESVLTAMDRSADPCEDFYRYACGTWLDTTERPADRPRWGRGFSEINERNLSVQREILETAADNPGSDPGLAKIGRFYRSCMDEEGVERAGITPLRPFLDEIATVAGVEGLMKAAGTLQQYGIPVLFRPAVAADFKNPDMNIAHLFQGGIGLPDREYYLKEDDRSVELRREYEAHVGRMLALLGESRQDAERHAAAVVSFETKLAEASLPRQEARNPDNIYHKIDLAGLKKTAPALPWDTFLNAAGYPGLMSINVSVPAFFARVSSVAADTDAGSLQAYLRWNVVHAMAGQLPAAFVDENFAFFGATLAGQEELQPRWKRCVDATDEALGEILGRFFVERRFAGESKEIALEMIRGIEKALEANLENLAWMDETTRARALEKMNALTNKIGYPDKWRDYSSLDVRPGDHFGNSLAAARFEFRREFDQVGKPVDKTEWGMTPPTVNAYYNPLVNEIVFPAGIMQRPFFHRDQPLPMNLGGIGMVMGHELTHGFDDQGRKFDPTGQLREWWEPGVVARFEERAQCVETLYSGYEVQPGLKLNGELTLGENIADLGGIKEAYLAYRNRVGAHGEPQPAVDGLTNDQLFFVGFAQTWCTLATPEIERVLTTVDTHAAPRFRVQGPLANFEEFAKAFNCPAGSPMNPETRCEVW